MRSVGLWGEGQALEGEYLCSPGPPFIAAKWGGGSPSFLGHCEKRVGQCAPETTWHREGVQATAQFPRPALRFRLRHCVPASAWVPVWVGSILLAILLPSWGREGYTATFRELAFMPIGSKAPARWSSCPNTGAALTE